MSKNKKKKAVLLTRWEYFIKTLRLDSSTPTEFTYGKKTYTKSGQLQRIENDNKRINALLLLMIIVLFYIGAQMQNILVFLLGIVLALAGQVVCLLHLPKDITAHLTDVGRSKR